MILGIMMGRISATPLTASAISFNGNDMGTAVTTDDGTGGNVPVIHIFAETSFVKTAQTLAYTRASGGLYVGGQLIGVSLSGVASIGTPSTAAR